MKISEESMIEAEVLAIEEINASGLSGAPDRVGDRRRPVGLADVRSGSTTIDRTRKSERHLRLLDVGQPQERQAGRRAKIASC